MDEDVEGELNLEMLRKLIEASDMPPELDTLVLGHPQCTDCVYLSVLHEGEHNTDFRPSEWQTEDDPKLNVEWHK